MLHAPAIGKRRANLLDPTATALGRMDEVAYVRHTVFVGLTLVGLMSLAAPTTAAAETIRQSVDVIGWTNTGSELVTSVTLDASGIDAEGDPVNWTYSVLEIRNARSGKVLNRYKVGNPPAIKQRGWEAAKPEQAGRDFLKKVGVIPAEDSQVSEDGSRVLVHGVTFDNRPMATISDTCPGCNECTTQLDLGLLDAQARAAYQLPSQTRTGNPFAPGDATPDCPTLGVRAFWHPGEPRLAVILSEAVQSTGALLESVRAYDLAKDAPGWKSTTLATPSRQMRRERAKAEEARLREALAAAAGEDKAYYLTLLGDHVRARGDLDAASGYYESALDFDASYLRAQLGRAHVLAERGETKKALRLARKVERKDRRAGVLNAELGLFRIATGDIDGAGTYLQAAVDSGGGADATSRIRLGHRILDADLAAGLAYLDNLFRGIDTDTVEAALLEQTAVRAAAAHLHLRDIAAAASYLKYLDPKSTDARRMALLIGALRTRDADRMQPILDGVDALLAQSPGDCGLYYVKGMAFLRLTQPRDAYVHLAAAVACDPDLEEAHYYLADMYRFAGKLAPGARHYARYLQLAPERRGDDARRLRRAVAELMIPRMEYTGVVLLRWECTTEDGIFCKGVLHNSSPAPSGPVPVSLVATAEQRRTTTEVGRSDVSVSGIAPGQSVNFAVRIAIPEPGGAVRIEAGRSQTERDLNRTPVGY